MTYACGRGDKQVLRLWARDGAFRAPARVTFFFCKKKVTKENHSNLRFKDPLARGRQVQIWRCVLAGGVQRSSLSVKRTVPAFTGAEASATACPSHGRGICFYRVGDYQIAPIAARSTAMGRWRLTPPGYEGTCLPAGRSADLTRHRPVIQHRGPIKGKAWRLRAGVQRKFTVFLQNLKVELRKASML